VLIRETQPEFGSHFSIALPRYQAAIAFPHFPRFNAHGAGNHADVRRFDAEADNAVPRDRTDKSASKTK